MYNGVTLALFQTGQKESFMLSQLSSGGFRIYNAGCNPLEMGGERDQISSHHVSDTALAFHPQNKLQGADAEAHLTGWVRPELRVGRDTHPGFHSCLHGSLPPGEGIT